MKTIGITGGTGFVGQYITSLLVNKGYNVIIFTTRVATKPPRPHITYAHWHPDRQTCDINPLKELDAVIHLSGAGIADKRWTDKRKQEILHSRIDGTRFLISRLREYASKCQALIAASAIGFYGADHNDAIPFTETAPPANDFLADTCVQWEQASRAAEPYFRTVILRNGIVLGREAGAFPELVQPMTLGIMPILGSGRQVVSWIEVTDLARLYLYTLENEMASGIYNAVSPNPVTHKQLMQTIAAIKGGIKVPMHVPPFALKLLLGELSSEVLKSCTVSAQKIMDTGYTFRNPEIVSAVKAILGK